MKVYIVTWFDGEPYSRIDGIEKVFSSMEKAQEYISNKGKGPHGENLKDGNQGYFLSDRVTIREVDK